MPRTFLNITHTQTGAVKRAAHLHTHMATTTHTPDYRTMTSDQLQDEAHEIFKAILAKLDGPQWLEISDMVTKYGSARFYHGAALQKELTQ